MEQPDDSAVVTFFKAYPAAINPMPADKAALGTVPTIAYRHCEPLRAASAYGWYIFPPVNFSLKWDGADISFCLDGERWATLSEVSLPGLGEIWDALCPLEMRGLAPPFLSVIPARGVVQVWSGFLVETKEDWSIHIRSLANVPRTRFYECYEGIVEADHFSPSPLFINIQLLATDVEIVFSAREPFFQVQPLRRENYMAACKSFSVRDVFSSAEGNEGFSDEEWINFRRTIRVDTPEAPLESGRYVAAARRRAKNE